MTRADLITLFQQKATEIAERDFSHVTEDNNIAELGIDSLQTLELVGELERELDVKIPDEQLVRRPYLLRVHRTQPTPRRSHSQAKKRIAARLRLVSLGCG